MKITTEFLQSIHACQGGIALVATYEDKDHEAVIRRLVADDHFNCANWLLPRLMDYKGYVSYAVFAAELVLPIWEKEYPNDNRPRLAIEAAKGCVDNPSEANKKAAEAAWAAAWAAKEAAAEAAEAAAEEAEAAWAAAWAAEAAEAAAAEAWAAKEAWAAEAAAAAAWAAKEAAAEAAEAKEAAAAWAERIKIKIIEYGLKLLQNKKYDN